MHIVIIGGHDCMACRYREICEEYGCTAKVYTQKKADMEGSISCSDMIILFTGTVSHGMVRIAKKAALRKNIAVTQSHTGSGSALRKILEGINSKMSKA